VTLGTVLIDRARHIRAAHAPAGKSTIEATSNFGARRIKRTSLPCCFSSSVTSAIVLGLGCAGCVARKTPFASPAWTMLFILRREVRASRDEEPDDLVRAAVRRRRGAP